jgi:hypothetical protein
MKIKIFAHKDYFLALFTVVQLWKQKQYKCLTTDEWIKKLWYINTMVYYSAFKKRNILTFCDN